MAKPINQPSTNQPEPTPAPSGMGSEAFFNMLGGKLLEQGGIISSTASNLEGNINKAIGGIRESADLSNQRIESVYGRERNDVLGTANDSMISGRAAGSGGLMNIAALRELTSTTDKQLNDLQQRKEELMLQNNADAAGRIADLELKTLEFRMNAQQKVFENLLGVGNFGTSVAQEGRLARAQTFEEKRAISNIGLEFGVEVGPNDTIETITAKAAPFASEQRRAELAKTLAETARVRADTAKMLSDGAQEDDDLDIIANAYFSSEMQGKDPSIVITNLSDTKASKVLLRADQLRMQNYIGEIQQEIDSGKSKNVLSSSIKNETNLSATQKSEALKYVNENWKEQPKSKKFENTAKFTTKKSGTAAVGLTTGIPVGTQEDLYVELSRILGF